MMNCNPKALIVSILAAAVLWYAIERQLGVIAVGVDALLTWGAWTLIPDRWFGSPRQPAR